MTAEKAQPLDSLISKLKNDYELHIDTYESIIEINNILEQHINGKSSIYFIIHLRNQIIEIELEKTYNLTPDIQSEINHLNGVKQISER